MPHMYFTRWIWKHLQAIKFFFIFFNLRLIKIIFFQLIFGSCLLALPFGTQPNIILVITDDQGYGPIGKHGNPWMQTPSLDKLHGQSTRFERFLVSPTCSPTRAALMSGRHPMKNGITHTILERERMALSTVTLPQVLSKVGYVSGIFGKWHVGDEEPYQPHKRGFDEVFIHGAGGSSAIWFKQIRYFSKYLNLLLNDLRGHGASQGLIQNPFKAKYSFESIADDIFEVMDYVKIEKSHLEDEDEYQNLNNSRRRLLYHASSKHINM